MLLTVNSGRNLAMPDLIGQLNNSFNIISEATTPRAVSRSCLDMHMHQFNTYISPEEAKSALTINYKHNRVLNKHTCSRYMREANLNRWVLHPNPIVFAKDKDDQWRLIDGQHRLTMVSQQDKSLPFSVCVYRSTSIYDKLDQGKLRTNADVLVSHKNIVLPIQYLLRSATSIRTPTPDDVKPLLVSEIGDLLTEVEFEIKPPMNANSIWKAQPFRAAYTMAVLTGAVRKSTARHIYATISRRPISEWPPIFAAFYRQMMEQISKPNRAGNSLDNDYFIRGYYCFANHSRKNRINIGPVFRSSLKENVQEYMATHVSAGDSK